MSFSIQPGEAVALVGRNGSGKSTTLKMLAGIIPPHDGVVEASGAIASMLELGSGFHPDFTGRENVFMNGAIHGLSEKAVKARFEDIVGFAELEDFIDMPVRTYSSGMQMRLAYAVAAHVQPDILLLDEVLAVGDAAFQDKCMQHIRAFHSRGGTLVFVSHAADVVRQVCDRAIVFEGGRVRADGPVDDVMPTYEQLLHEREGSVGGTIESIGGGEPLGDHGNATASHGPVRLEAVQVFGPTGGRADEITAGEAVTVKAIVVADMRREELDLAIHITEATGGEFIGVCSSEAGIQLVAEPAPVEYAATFQLPAQEGSLDVTVVLRDRRSGEILARHVEASAIRMRRSLPGQGLVALPVSWTQS